MEQREKLIELIQSAKITEEYFAKDILTEYSIKNIADFLLANGVVVLPCRCGECVHYRKEDGYCAVMQGFCGNDDFYCMCATKRR